jgi:hypothetical protein
MMMASSWFRIVALAEAILDRIAGFAGGTARDFRQN